MAERTLLVRPHPLHGVRERLRLHVEESLKNPHAPPCSPRSSAKHSLEGEIRIVEAVMPGWPEESGLADPWLAARWPSFGAAARDDAVRDLHVVDVVAV
jgi:hypothetical protein